MSQHGLRGSKGDRRQRPSIFPKERFPLRFKGSQGRKTFLQETKRKEKEVKRESKDRKKKQLKNFPRIFAEDSSIPLGRRTFGMWISGMDMAGMRSLLPALLLGILVPFACPSCAQLLPPASNVISWKRPGLWQMSSLVIFLIFFFFFLFNFINHFLYLFVP